MRDAERVGQRRARPAPPRESSRPWPHRSADRPRASGSPRPPRRPARARAAPPRRCRPRPTSRPAPDRGRLAQLLARTRPPRARARCSASAASCAACRLAGVSPPIASSTSSVPIRAASSTGSPSTISATAAVAARVAPHPSASKRDARQPPSSISREIRERSPQAAPPAAPVKAPSPAGPRDSRPADSAQKAPGSSLQGTGRR